MSKNSIGVLRPRDSLSGIPGLDKTDTYTDYGSAGMPFSPGTNSYQCIIWAGFQTPLRLSTGSPAPLVQFENEI